MRMMHMQKHYTQRGMHYFYSSITNGATYC